MTEKAKALGIPERDLTLAMTLIRDFRIRAIKNGLDSRATRIAILFADLSDEYFAKQRLSENDLAKLEEIARELFSSCKDPAEGTRTT
jgi:hypothetical protein